MSAIYDIPVAKNDGSPSRLSEFTGKVLLIVNVASKCGFTPQYESLERLYRDQRQRGLVVLGFPTNDFGAQEPGTDEEIAQFCSTSYGVDFPLFSKISVQGETRHPLYRSLIAAQPRATEKPDGSFAKQMAGYGISRNDPSDVFWNFEKFLVARDGTVVGRFTSDIGPDDPLLADAIEHELNRSI
jgi:glutathione peroxidase